MTLLLGGFYCMEHRTNYIATYAFFLITLRKNYIDEIRYIVYTNKNCKLLESLLIEAHCINKFTMLSMGVSMGIKVPEEIISIHDK